MNTKKTWIWVVIAAICGFTIGQFVSIPPTSKDHAGGDISKVNKFQKNSVSPQLSAFQERMLNNPDEMNSQVATLLVLNSRLTDFDNLISITGKVTENRAELAEAAGALKNLATMSENARQSSHDALISFDQLMGKESKKGDIAYDQASQNATLGFLKVERQVTCGKNFVLAADEYLMANGVNGNEDLALIRDLWQDFCHVDAVMNADKAEVNYWTGVDKSLSAANNQVGIQMVKAIEGGADFIKAASSTEFINLSIAASAEPVMANGFNAQVTVLANGVNPLTVMNFKENDLTTLKGMEGNIVNILKNLGTDLNVIQANPGERVAVLENAGGGAAVIANAGERAVVIWNAEGNAEQIRFGVEQEFVKAFGSNETVLKAGPLSDNIIKLGAGIDSSIR